MSDADNRRVRRAALSIGLWVGVSSGVIVAIGIGVLIGISWAFFNHLMSGIRHLVLDVGAGYEVDRNNRWSTISILLGILLTVLFWAVILFAK